MQSAMNAGVQVKVQVAPEPAVRKGPWTMEEDHVLVSYIAAHGEGAWINLARAAGLRRTGKSCRLRWLNYLRPDVRRGNMTAEEQELIVQMQARWGNKWSRIAKHLPARTDNEIKNFWRTKIQQKPKHRDNVADIWSTTAAAGRGTSAVTDQDQGSSNYSDWTGVTQDYGIVTQQPASISSVTDHLGLGYEVHGGGDAGAGAMDDFIPESLSASGESFWAIGNFWTTMQSYQGSS